MPKTITISDETWEKLKHQLTEESSPKKTIIYKTDGSVLYESDKENLKEALVEANLSGASLSEADLRGTNLSGVDLSEADLSEADLCGANLYRANLYGANLYGANLSGANLYGANLRKADLHEANLREAELDSARFYGKTNNPQILNRNQVEDFLAALGFEVEG